MNIPDRPLSSNFTTPSIKENKVSSLPRPTLLPGFHFVPRWRARILPPSTRSPPNFFKPRRCEFESRPLRDEPTPFFRAINQRRTHLLGRSQNIQLHGSADFTGERRHAHPAALFDAKLFAACFDNC